jgi:tetratricopeptide (TPR) repeat protein
MTPSSAAVPQTIEEFCRQARDYLYKPPNLKLRSLAISFYAKALALQPDNAELHLELARAYWRFGMTDEMQHYTERALALQPDSLRVHFRACMLQVPYLYRSAAEVELSLARYQQGLEELLDRARNRACLLPCQCSRRPSTLWQADLPVAGSALSAVDGAAVGGATGSRGTHPRGHCLSPFL